MTDAPLITTHLVTTSRQDQSTTNIITPLHRVRAAISAMAAPKTMQQGEQTRYLLILKIGSDIQIDDKLAATPVEDRTLKPVGSPVTFTVEDAEQRGGVLPATRARLVKITQ